MGLYMGNLLAKSSHRPQHWERGNIAYATKSQLPQYRSLIQQPCFTHSALFQQSNAERAHAKRDVISPFPFSRSATRIHSDALAPNENIYSLNRLIQLICQTSFSSPIAKRRGLRNRNEWMYGTESKPEILVLEYLCVGRKASCINKNIASNTTVRSKKECLLTCLQKIRVFLE